MRYLAHFVLAAVLCLSTGAGASVLSINVHRAIAADDMRSGHFDDRAHDRGVLGRIDWESREHATPGALFPLVPAMRATAAKGPTKATVERARYLAKGHVSAFAPSSDAGKRGISPQGELRLAGLQLVSAGGARKAPPAMVPVLLVLTCLTLALTGLQPRGPARRHASVLRLVTYSRFPPVPRIRR